ncbi:hypothetical protein EDD33_1759 [Nocardioides aurantiacus]|uniref:Uncharacterized protein n=1 Tax=Nocardioides aurantiacus TaxID=86796 RepID=A0A3N2CTP7_9ACTN|nr:hypothetical protein EDD33_1759 [Nocardioides aurantiacus]
MNKCGRLQAATRRAFRALTETAQVLVENHAVVLSLAGVAIAALISHRSWDYWSSLAI